MEYLVSDKEGACVFCEKIHSQDDRDNLVLYRGAQVAIMMNLYPYNTGHLMVIPYAHVPSLEDLDAETQAEMMRLVTRALQALRETLRPDGFNVGVNIGRAAGAGISDHVHLHVVPRWQGDTNFMPVIADVRVIPQSLDATYEQLVDAFARLEGEG